MRNPPPAPAVIVKLFPEGPHVKVPGPWWKQGRRPPATWVRVVHIPPGARVI